MNDPDSVYSLCHCHFFIMPNICVVFHIQYLCVTFPETRPPPCESTTTQSCFYSDAASLSLSAPLCAHTSSQSSDTDDLSCSPQPPSRRYAQPSQHGA